MELLGLSVNFMTQFCLYFHYHTCLVCTEQCVILLKISLKMVLGDAHIIGVFGIAYYCNNLIVYIYRVEFIASVVYVELYSMHGIKVIQTYSGLSMRY